MVLMLYPPNEGRRRDRPTLFGKGRGSSHSRSENPEAGPPEEGAREQQHFEQCETSDLTNLVNRRTWRIRGDSGGSIMVDARVPMIAAGAPGEREFVVVVRALT